MARPSKIKPFAVYIPAKNSEQPSFDDTLRSQAHSFQDDDVFDIEEEDCNAGKETVLDVVDKTVNIQPTDTEPEDVRRESAVTSTSISSLPESSFETDQERSLPMHKP